jgi:acetate kinase
VNVGGQILVLNAGSSSLKLGMFDATAEEQLAEKQVSWAVDEEVGHEAVLRDLVADIDLKGIAAVGHRVVHGGTRFTQAIRIDDAVRAEIEALASLAPLHNRAALAGIETISHLLRGIPQVAAFDTAFHATLPPRAYLYALPYAWYERWGVRRFGFHGLSHAYCAGRAAELLGLRLAQLKLVTCHLGSGCSLAAIDGGRSIATTMGFTPLDGLVMATRPGSVDPGILTFLMMRGQLTPEGLQRALQHESGLKGVSGLSGDMRELLAARAAGHRQAALAFDLYVSRLREGIAAMTTHLGGLDGLVFTAGVGEGAADVRAAACAGLGWMGIGLEAAANARAVPDADVTASDSRVRVLVVHTREDLMVARQTRAVLEA